MTKTRNILKVYIDQTKLAEHPSFIDPPLHLHGHGTSVERHATTLQRGNMR